MFFKHVEFFNRGSGGGQAKSVNFLCNKSCVAAKGHAFFIIENPCLINLMKEKTKSPNI